MIAGKGHETYQIIDGIKYHFDDREESPVNTVKTLPCGGHMAPISLTASQIADWCNGEVLQQVLVKDSSLIVDLSKQMNGLWCCKALEMGMTSCQWRNKKNVLVPLVSECLKTGRVGSFKSTTVYWRFNNCKGISTGVSMVRSLESQAVLGKRLHER